MIKSHTVTVVDPGFHRRQGRQPLGKHQHTILPNLPKNGMKLKEFGPGGDESLAPPLDPPVRKVRGYQTCDNNPGILFLFGSLVFCSNIPHKNPATKGYDGYLVATCSLF